MALVLYRAPDQHIIRIKHIFKYLFILCLLSYCALIHPQISHKLEILGHLHLKHGSPVALLVLLIHSLGLLIIVLVRVISMQVILGDGHRLYEGIEALYLHDVLAVAILVLNATKLAVELRVDVKEIGAVGDIAVEAEHVLVEV